MTFARKRTPLLAGPTPSGSVWRGDDIFEVVRAHFVFFVERLQGFTGRGKLFHHFFRLKTAGK